MLGWKITICSIWVYTKSILTWFITLTQFFVAVRLRADSSHSPNVSARRQPGVMYCSHSSAGRGGASLLLREEKDRKFRRHFRTTVPPSRNQSLNYGQDKRKS